MKTQCAVKRLTREERRRQVFAADVHRLISQAYRLLRFPNGSVVPGAPLSWVPTGVYREWLTDLVAQGRFEITEHPHYAHTKKTVQYVRAGTRID